VSSDVSPSPPSATTIEKLLPQATPTNPNLPSYHADAMQQRPPRPRVPARQSLPATRVAAGESPAASLITRTPPAGASQHCDLSMSKMRGAFAGEMPFGGFEAGAGLMNSGEVGARQRDRGFIHGIDSDYDI